MRHARWLFTYLLLLIALLSGSLTWAQTSYTDESIKYTPSLPPPPEAAALGKFGQTPVSLHTGIPHISIPLYALDLPDLSVPISLSYHAGGIRASEHASNVGLGWALQAGGTISSTAYGLPDFSLQGYVRGSIKWTLPTDRPFRPVILNDTTRVTSPDYDLAMAATGATPGGDGTIRQRYGFDTQPDVFHYSFAGRSGQFFHTQDGKAHPMPFEPLAIERRSGTPYLVAGESGRGYTITDEKGTTYLFDQPEITTTRLRKYGGPVNPADELTPQSTTYRLSRIQTVRGHSITFTYDTLTYSYRNVTSRTRFRKLQDNYCDPRADNYTESFSVVKSLILKKITSNLGHDITFEYSGCRRQDLAGSRALTAVVVQEGASKRRFELQYSYFGAVSTSTLCSLPAAAATYQPEQDQYRLKLTAVQEIGKPAYRVTYLTDFLPNRLEAGEDHWGYLNGSTASSFPADLRNGFNGQSKEPDSAAMVQGIIKELYYPTGGHTRFVFEPNGYRLPTDSILTVVNRSVSVYATDSAESDRHYRLRIPFTIKHGEEAFNPASVLVQFATPPCNTATPQYNIQLYWEGTLVAQYCGTSPPGGQSGNVNGGPRSGYLPGNYTLVIDKYGQVGESYFTLSWAETIKVARTKLRQLTGGLRIRSTQDFDGLGATPATRKRYYYAPLRDTTQSSGVTLGAIPTYTTTITEYVRGCATVPDPSCYRYSCDFLMQTTNSQLPLSTIKGNNMAYTSVLVLSDTQGKVGLSQHRFSHAEDYNPYAGYPFTQPTSHDWERGLPVEETDFVYHAAHNYFSPVRRVRRHYTSRFTPPVVTSEATVNSTPPTQPNEAHALGINLSLVSPEFLVSTSPTRIYGAEFNIQVYKLLSVWLYQDRQQEYQFDPNDSTRYSLTTTTYRYDNPRHAQRTASTTETGFGESLTTRFAYPLDFDTTSVRSPAALAIRSLARAHRIGVVVESQQLKHRNNADYVVGGQLVEYAGQWPRRLRSLESAAPLASASTFLARLEQGEVVADTHYRDNLWFDRYDAAGNVVELHRPGQKADCYLWGYNSSRLIATVKNATYAEVVAVLGQAVIDELASATPGTDAQVQQKLHPLRQQLKQAQVTTSSYNPLVGMTSQRDPSGRIVYYEYDALGRLLRVRDEQGRLLSQQEYQYAAQP